MRQRIVRGVGWRTTDVSITRTGNTRAALAALALAVVMGVPGQTTKRASAQPFDVVIEHGHVIDGTGSPWYSADIGIRQGRIAAIGRLAGAPRKQTIAADGLTVAPGFIDMLGQSEEAILADPRLPSKIFQGITTEITGEGRSIAPLTPALRKAHGDSFARYGIQPDWTDFAGYFARLERQGMGTNLGSFVGATTVREVVLGEGDVQPTAVQLATMQDLVRQSMRQGAMGLSTALMYAPAPYAKTPELVALAKPAAELGGVYATHVRTEGAGEPQALEEAFAIGHQANIPVEIWHLKAAGKGQWGSMPQIVASINRARASGLDVSANVYAYPAWANDLSAFLPPWAHDGGDARMLERLRDPEARKKLRAALATHDASWDNEWQEIPGPEAVLICDVSAPALKPLEGKRLSEIAALWHTDAMDALFDLLLKDSGTTEVAVFGMSEADNVLALQQPWTSVGTDWGGDAETGVLARGYPHPRGFGTFPRILHTYVAEDHALTLPDAIRKFSALPASQMRLADRGVLKEGMWADVVVFDAAAVRDTATFADPRHYALGMHYVLVNGVPVIADGHMTGALPGRVLRGPGVAQP